MLLTAVVAVARDGVIGRDNAMPWHLPADLQHFKAVTLGKPVLMGRRTFEAIGRPLPGRRNLVLTRTRGLSLAGAEVVHTLQQAIDAAAAGGAQELMVIGGAELYALALPRIGRIHLTELQLSVQGDARFPALVPTQWRELSRTERPADDRNACAMSFVTLERV